MRGEFVVDAEHDTSATVIFPRLLPSRTTGPIVVAPPARSRAEDISSFVRRGDALSSPGPAPGRQHLWPLYDRPIVVILRDRR